jgi:SAM-dependent methyltransferase
VARVSPESSDSKLLQSMQSDWEKRAKSDPLFAIDSSRKHESVGSFYTRSAELVPEIIEPVLAALSVDPGDSTVLEIGCGMGRLFPGLSGYFSNIIGIDISAAMVEQGRENCPVSAAWIVGDGESLAGVDDVSIDHVLSFEVFQHIPYLHVMETYLDEVKRVLRPGGTFQIQMRSGSDTPRQDLMRRMPRAIRVIASVPLKLIRRTGMRLFGVIPAEGDIDTWLGLIVPPNRMLGIVSDLGFEDLAILPDTIHPPGMGYWVIGRKSRG